MNPAALTPALFTAPAAPPTPAQGQAGASSAQTGQQDPARFSQLLDSNSPAASDQAVPPGDGSIVADAAAQDLQDEATQTPADAPWPPPGLETLLAPAVTAPAPATGAACLAAAATAAQAQPASMAPAASSPAALASVKDTALAAPMPGAHPAQTPLPTLARPAGSSNHLDLAESLPASPQMPAGSGADEALAQAIGSLAGTAMSTSPALDSNGMVALAGLSASAAASPLPANDTQASVLPTRADMGGEHFDADVAQGVEYMVEHKLQSARIRISPQQLGMIEVELRLDGDRVHANFSSAHADVRQALHDSLPRLRELLDANGLQMGQAAVGQGSNGPGTDGRDGQRPATAMGHGGTDTELSPAAAAPQVWRHNRLLDTYA